MKKRAYQIQKKNKHQLLQSQLTLNYKNDDLPTQPIEKLTHTYKTRTVMEMRRKIFRVRLRNTDDRRK